MKIYLTDLSAYNQGFLIGSWVSLPISEDELREEIQSILKEGAEACQDVEHEEYFITDYEFDGEAFMEIGEYTDPFRINETAEMLEDLSDYDMKRVSFLIKHIGMKLEDAVEYYEDVVIYENSTLEQIAEDYIYETINMDDIPDIIRNNIDFKGIAVDFDCSGEYTEVGNDIYHYVN